MSEILYDNSGILVMNALQRNLLGLLFYKRDQKSSAFIEQFIWALVVVVVVVVVAIVVYIH